MLDKVFNVKAIINILFSDGQTYELPLVNKNYMIEDLDTYGTSIKLSEQLYSKSNTNIVGNICCNSLSIEAVSYDGLLISSNEESPFHGLMNDTAMVELYVLVEDENDPIFMGRYFVSAWESGTTNSTANNVSISCVDLLSKIKNIALDKIRLHNNLNVVEYLKLVIDKLNSKLSENMKVLYNEEDLDIYKNSKYDWQMYYNNIDRTDIESIFNNIAQNTISYIWIDRDRHLRTDHLLDDVSMEAVSSLSGSTNILEYGSQAGDIGKYSGVEVQYINSVSYEDKEVLSIDEYQLSKGINKINNLTLNSNKVFNIHLINIETEEGQARCKTFNVYKNNLDMNVESTKKTKASIHIYGTVVNETTDSFTQYINNDNKGDTIKIENSILRKEMIHTYADGLISMMKMKNNRLYANGWINPKIRLGQNVYMEGTSLGINNYYKVVGLEFTFGTSYRCQASLLRTIGVEPNIKDITYQHVEYMYDRLTGVYVNASEIVPLNEEENAIVEVQLADSINKLRDRLYGGD